MRLRDLVDGVTDDVVVFGRMVLPEWEAYAVLGAFHASSITRLQTRYLWQIQQRSRGQTLLSVPSSVRVETNFLLLAALLR